MDPSTPDSDRDDRVETLLREAAPRAPRGFADGVMRRLEHDRARRRRHRAWSLGVGALVAVAAAVVLWLVRLPANAHLVPSGWSVVAQAGLTMTAPDGRPARDPDVGVQLAVAHGGSATLERALAHVTLTEDSQLRVAEGGVLQLSTGGARLEGPETRIDGDVATVAALGVNADIAVQLERRTNMNASTKLTKTTLATLATVMTVAAHGGGALVQAREHAPVLLAENDRATMVGTLPPLVTRAPVLLAKNDVKATPTTKPAAQTDAKTQPSNGAGSANTQPPVDDGDRDKIRTVMRTALPDLKSCYETALSKNANLAGQVRVKMTLLNRDRNAVVDEAEVMPMGEGDLVAPLFEQCIIGVVGKLQFPTFQTSDGKLIVEYPFLFAAKEPK